MDPKNFLVQSAIKVSLPWEFSMLISKCMRKKNFLNVIFVVKNTKTQVTSSAIRIHTMETSRISVRFVGKSIYKPRI